MCQKIEKVLQLAKVTFSRSSPESKINFKRNLKNLTEIVGELTGLDVGLEKCFMLAAAKESQAQNKQCTSEMAPVTYIPICENTDISLGIFVVCEDKKIPLHDHPHMHGIIKCIEGKLKITSYTRKTPKYDALPKNWKKDKEMKKKIDRGFVFIAEETQRSILTPETEPCVLEPHQLNLHEIHSVDGPAAFLDILAPPYNVDPHPNKEDQQLRDCHYFKDLGCAGQSYKWLEFSEPPSSFYCDTEDYQGPKLGT